MMTSNQLPVRCWWGFRRPDLSQEQFLSQLGSLFIPATIYVPGVRLQVLTAYMPAILPTHTDRRIPDEVALVFYSSINAYNKSMTSLEGRSYQLLHSAVFAIPPSSTVGFPPQLGGELSFGQPYFLYAKSGTNWQAEDVQFLCGVRKSNMSPAQFKAALLEAFTELQSSECASVIVVRASEDCLTAWAIAPSHSDLNALGALSDLVDVVLLSKDKKAETPSDLDGAANWLTVEPADFFNFQFEVGKDPATRAAT